MIDRKNLPRESECRRAAGYLDGVLGRLFAYADRKKISDRAFRPYYDLEDVWESFPDSWEEFVLGMLAGHAVAGTQKGAAAFVRSVGDSLAPAESALARLWRRVPWTWVILTEIETLGDEMVRGVPLGTRPREWGSDAPAWDELLIHSPALSRTAEAGIRSAIALLWWGGGFFGTYGVIVSPRAFDADDLLFYVAALDADGVVPPVIDVARPVSDRIARSPLEFLVLFEWQEVPRTVGRMGDWVRCAATIALPTDDPEVADRLGDVDFWRAVAERAGVSVGAAVTNGDVVAVRLGDGMPMYEPELFIVPGQGIAYLAAMNGDAWERGRAAVAAVLSFPEVAQSRVSMTMLTIATKTLDYTDEPLRLNGLLPDGSDDDQYDPDGEDSPDDAEGPSINVDIDQLNAVMRRVSENYNEGREESDEEVAAALDVPVDAVAFVRGQLDAMVNRAAGPASAAAETLGLAPAPFGRLARGGIPAEPGVLAFRDLSERPLSGDEARALAEVPLMRIARWFAEIATMARGRAVIPATQAGFVTGPIVRRALDEGIVSSPFSDSAVRRREADILEFYAARRILEAAGLMQLTGTRFVLDEQLRALAAPPASHGESFADLVGSVMSSIVTAMFLRFPWDERRITAPLPQVRQMAGFLLYAVNHLSRGTAASDGWIPIEPLIDAFIDAVPPIRAALASDEESARRAFVAGEFHLGVQWTVDHGVRHSFVCRFGEPLGLLEVRYAPDHLTLEVPVAIRPGPTMAILFDR